ncbi:hypothetical protein CYMTET_8002 [Cymbomonas tetramitiformis]|uniref:Uncharacterized protein n=1 Tax=Cymbomonas tetramitiformis TaxID=36881 RepID=A0AAE0GUB3_9CHLO|nr:hypothetical protein CYMTET_8002 [Cymbomonas tetramitiformis]
MHGGLKPRTTLVLAALLLAGTASPSEVSEAPSTETAGTIASTVFHHGGSAIFVRTEGLEFLNEGELVAQRVPPFSDTLLHPRRLPRRSLAQTPHPLLPPPPPPPPPPPSTTATTTASSPTSTPHSPVSPKESEEGSSISGHIALILIGCFVSGAALILCKACRGHYGRGAAEDSMGHDREGGRDRDMASAVGAALGNGLTRQSTYLERMKEAINYGQDPLKASTSPRNHQTKVSRIGGSMFGVVDVHRIEEALRNTGSDCSSNSSSPVLLAPFNFPTQPVASVSLHGSGKAFE